MTKERARELEKLDFPAENLFNVFHQPCIDRNENDDGGYNDDDHDKIAELATAIVRENAYWCHDTRLDIEKFLETFLRTKKLLMRSFSFCRKK